MSAARFVVIEGPDLGLEFELPLRGGGIGRGEGNVVQLSDLAVSRNHCSVELRDGHLTLLDKSSRNRTLVNGKPVSAHPLEGGDEVSIGKTRLAYLPADGGVAVMRQPLPSRVTMEVGSGELIRAATAGLAKLRTPGQTATFEDRARRHLASLATLGNSLGAASDQPSLGRASCQAALLALAADRAFLLLRDNGGRMTPTAAAVSQNASGGTQLSLSREVTDKVVADGKAIALEPDDSDRAGVAAPLVSFPDERVIGMLYADRLGAEAWDQVDVMAATCLAQLISAAMASLAAREVLSAENRELQEQLGGREFVGSSARAVAVLGFVNKVGPSDATVLLTGESGSGKEMVARAVHKASRRNGGPFVAVNCAALTETLIESELFGHEKGAFTGATDRKLGRFETADKGTLFLDEVGELPLNCQTKFLRVLEEQMFERVGGTRSISVDVRVVAATNRDLAEMVRRGAFREDLYYRLSVIHTVVPPLRERRDDIPELAEYFLHRLKSQVGRRISGFAPEAMRALVAHSWPGNVRELKNAVERAIVLGDGDLIRSADLPPNMHAGSQTPPTAPFAHAPQSFPQAPQQGYAAPAAGFAQPAPSPHGFTPPAGGPAMQPPPAPQPPAARSLRDLERDGIVAALAATGGNKAQAAAILEIDRSTLYKKIKDYGIT